MTKNLQIKLIKRPAGVIDSSLFEQYEADIPVPAEGQFLVKQTEMSLDPAMIGWMSPDTDSYVPPVELGAVMRSSGVGEVLSSKHPDFQVGDKVMGMFGWQQYALSQGHGVNKLDSALPDDLILSVFALPGLTATHGLFNIGRPQAGETLVVSGAAGSVGSIVGQLAKAEGLRVVGVAGSDEKCQWLVDVLGFDAAINYNASDLAIQLNDATAGGIDVYFENTGGPIQHLVYERMNAHGRIVVCGHIADYLSTEPSPGPNWMNIIKKRLLIQGFTMPDHLHQAQQLMAKLSPYVAAGQIKYRSHRLEGLPSAIDGLNLLFTGGNKGKLTVKL